MEKVVIYGFGVSGKGAKKLLESKNIDCEVYDDKVSSKDEKERIYQNIKEFSLMVKSPGISFENEFVKYAKSNGVEIIDEIELAARYSKEKIIAVTGTNGKTTTTTKLKELLEYAGYNVEACGNIGKSFAEVVSENRELDFVVLELSSYQLEAIKEFKAYISMIINLSPDHLNRYENLSGYYDAKFNIMKNQDEETYTIINLDDEEVLKRIVKVDEKIKKVYVSKKSNKKNANIFVKNGKVVYNSQEILSNENLTLKGIHNLENILFIVATAKIIGIEDKIIQEFLYTTKGLEHRMEEFYKTDNFIFINDSKGTNLDSTVKAIESFDEKIILICGGKDKKLDLEPLGKLIIEKAESVFLIGETADKLERILLDYGYNNNKIYKLYTIEKVVEVLDKELEENKQKYVLFSPAASSFDQFKSFEHRGDIFKELVTKKYSEI
jgi:UDP-N-acetylmuramoylalanine--D-glutamate ligase